MAARRVAIILRSSLVRPLSRGLRPFSSLSNPRHPPLSQLELSPPPMTSPFLPRRLSSDPFLLSSRSFSSDSDVKLPAIFYFTATWCGPCRAIAPVIEQLSQKFPHVTTYKIDIDQVLYRLLPGNTIDWVCFCPVTARNRLVTVNFDRRRLLPGGISLATAWLQRERRNKKERERERGRTSRPDPTLPSLDDPNPSLPSLAERRKRGRGPWKYTEQSAYLLCGKYDAATPLSKLMDILFPTFHFFHDGQKATEVVGADVQRLKDTMENLYK
ncbi:hypothetical protein GW17_00021530 [Ensete ventricosum]|nr:hypothetical protein GW17_00021530 [Ensete ventricosum]